MKSFKKYFLIAAFAAVAGLTGCESKADRERKPGVAETMIETSLQISEKGPLDSTKAEYSDRLRSVLMNVSTEDLETIKASGITVCLDQRLSQQNHGAWDRRIDGIYYIQDKIVSLYDNGKVRGASGLLELDAYHYGSFTLSKLAEKIRDNEIPSQGKFMFAGRYSYQIGTATCTETRWKSAEYFEGGIAKNPQLLTPPVKTAISSTKPVTPSL